MDHPRVWVIFLLLGAATIDRAQSDFNTDFTITWASDHVKVSNDGQQLDLSLDKDSGSGFASTKEYLFGSIDMQIKLVPGNSAGTVTAYYFFSNSTQHDELDFEFLGNVSGQPYILQTNVFASGVGEREQRIYLWFDPTTDFHTYSILWNTQQIVFKVDGTPIRVFPNNEALGVPYLKAQPMGIFSSIWDGDSWATMGGLAKINWTEAPFIASYRNYTIDACFASEGQDCIMAGKWWNQGAYLTLASEQQDQLKWVQDKYIIYDYCTDVKRYPTPPVECIHQFASLQQTPSSNATIPALSPDSSTLNNDSISVNSIIPHPCLVAAFSIALAFIVLSL